MSSSAALRAAFFGYLRKTFVGGGQISALGVDFEKFLKMKKH